MQLLKKLKISKKYIGEGMQTESILKSMEQKKERILYYDLLKIIAAFLVVFYHFSFYKLDYDFSVNVPYYPNVNRIIMCFAACSVPLFFMINGILLFNKTRTVKSIYKKAFKILILLLIWNIFKFPSWFLKTLIILYLLFPLFQYLYHNQFRIYLLIICLLFIFPFTYNLVILILKVHGINLNINFSGLIDISIKDLNATGLFTMYSLFYFLIGPILKKKTLNKYFSILMIVIGLALVLLECIGYTNLYQCIYDGVNSSFPTIGAVFLSFGVFFLVKEFNFERFDKIIVLFGSNVLTVYLLHMLFIILFDNLVTLSNYNLITCLFISIIIYLICTLIGIYASKIPLVNYFFKI